MKGFSWEREEKSSVRPEAGQRLTEDRKRPKVLDYNPQL
jgi:hypothetical protein